MGIKSNIKRFLFISFWCVIGAGLLVLLVAAMRVKNEKDCAGYNIDIKSPGEHLFIDKKDIEEQLTVKNSYSIKGRAIENFDLRKMEEALEKTVWISRAELFFDNNQMLQVKISERQPVARIFTANGNSFYIDSGSVRLPLSDKLSAKLPVFTNFPSAGDRFSKADKALLKQVKTISNYISASPFWMAQVAQIDITGSGTFELVPTVGNHIIELGDATDCDKKFKKLFLFYQQVISKTGFDRYERIKIQYAGQVVGVKQASAMSRYDSIQAIKNVEKLIALAQTEQERMIRMDSIEVANMRHRTDSSEMPAKLIMPDSTIEKPNIKESVTPSIPIKKPKA